MVAISLKKAFSSICLLYIFIIPCLSAASKPNIVLFFTDDQGYNDVGCFGSKDIKTPHFDSMASQGMKFTNFYAQAVCGPSRAALMTGCYPLRIAEPKNRKELHTVLHTKEITIAEILKEQGYKTACIGKWHLSGSYRPPYPAERMPRGQGFDYFYGTPKFNGARWDIKGTDGVYENDKMLIKALNYEQNANLTKTYTEKAIKYMRKSVAEDKPFFLYLSHNMPHVPLGVSEKFKAQSEGRMYNAVIEELDWSMGEIQKELRSLKIEKNTIVVFCSDNGPWIEKQIPRTHSGNADPFKGAKMTMWEGGAHVPCIMQWPGVIPENKECKGIVTTMDLLPTFAEIAGAKVPEDRVIDGKDLLPLISGETDKSPRDTFFYLGYTRIFAVRKENWKLVTARKARPKFMGWWARMIDEVPVDSLFDLDKDPGETKNLASQYPEIVKELHKEISKASEDMGNSNVIGKNARFFDGPAPATRKD